MHRITAVRQIENHTPEPLAAEPSPFEVGITIAKLEIYTSPGIDQIFAFLVQAGGETLRSEIHKIINCLWIRKNCLISGRVYYCTSLQERR
jgi:hypothetical protein